MKSKAAGPAYGVLALTLILVVALVPAAQAQGAAPSAPSGESELQVGPATIPHHWSKYKYPETIPEGARQQPEQIARIER